ncbi:DHA2 family efflux MFS transporter permease subunit [Nocardioides sp. TRM66260-LWL]|uniref:MFS transporter n=1 Tax=Nocardioides sp. TRM66260-LWL TaxID=2874478 RepID=UPI001CC4EB54|nr:MFS transporter [Nocardioides sp. TRM66260-LWL]MBZ5735620.1 DHA2 family efflux MFS transporter permease subunit [Nocardioides sp. TRM66260-LWL]
MSTVRKPLVLVTVCLAALSINLDTTIVNVAVPDLSAALDAGTRQLLWIVDGYNLAFAALVLAMGSLSDRFGRRPALLLGLAGFGLSSAVAALAQNAEQLIALRFVMGAFAALIFPTTLSIIANTFTERTERAAALGAWGAATGMGVALGPVTGGWLLEHFTWHAVFWALVPVAVLAIAMTVAFVPESRDPAVPRLDLPGLGISVAALGLLTYTIIEGPEHGWSSTATLTGFAGAALLIGVFVAVERRVAHPMLDVRLFSDPRFSAASGAVTIAFFSLFGFIFLITQYFQLLREYSPLGAGARTIPVAASIAVASVLGGLLGPRLGAKTVVTLGLTLLGSSFLWISTSEVTTSYPTVIVPQMILMGLGLGMVSTVAAESILQTLPPARAGVGSAVNDATRELGGTLGVAVIGSVFSSVYASRLGELLDGARLPAEQLRAAQESVGVANALGARMPEVRSALETAFMDGLATGCLVIGSLCLLGALGALVALPGRRWMAAHEAAGHAAPDVPAAVPAAVPAEA